MPKYQLRKWRHPATHDLYVYVNGLETTEEKVWFERGDRIGTALPPTYGIKLCTKHGVTLTEETKAEVAEAFSTMDLFLDKVDWTRLGRAAEW
jgi:hypothetical protein